MDKIFWRSDNWKVFSERVWGHTLTTDNFFDDGRIHHQQSFIEILDKGVRDYNPPDAEDYYYIKMVRGTEFFILPKRFIKEFPINPKKILSIKLKKTETQVWKYITSVESMKVPTKKSWTFKKYIDNFNPVSHNEPMTWTFLKIFAHCQGVKAGICGVVGSGKNINLTLRRYMARNILPKAKNMTQARFYACLYHNSWVNIDEINSWQSEKVHQVESLCTDAADDSPDMDKYAKDKNRNMEIISVLNKSITFTYNRPDELKKIDRMFEARWNNPAMICDRYPRFLVQGQVTETLKKVSEGETKKMVDDNFEEMCEIVSNEAYWREHYHNHLKHWDRGVCVLQRRHLVNFSPVLDRLDVYCSTQEEFDEWMKFVNKMYQDYNNLVKQYTEHDYSTGRLV